MDLYDDGDVGLQDKKCTEVWKLREISIKFLLIRWSEILFRFLLEN